MFACVHAINIHNHVYIYMPFIYIYICIHVSYEIYIRFDICVVFVARGGYYEKLFRDHKNANDIDVCFVSKIDLSHYLPQL